MEKWIETPSQLVEAATREGFSMDENEAGIILGYMEGHDYALGLDKTGNLIRNDLDHAQGKDTWEEYSVRDAILFAVDMCLELMEAEEDEGKLASLRADDAALTSLYEAAMGVR